VLEMGVDSINDELELVTVPLRGACELGSEELGEVVVVVVTYG
jgi:hypothetical protein